MIRFQGGARRARAHFLMPAVALALTCAGPAAAVDTKASGRVTFGSSYRLEAADPNLLYSFNAAASGQTGLSGSGQNADDANTNFRRHDATSRALKAYVDLSATEGKFSALVRIKAWHDFALADNPRAWGNIPSGYAAGQPLSDAGAPRLSRFSGVALSDYYVQHSADIGGMHLLGRVGQQSLAWGGAVGFAGGLGAVNPVDMAAMRRPGAVPQEMKVPVPTLFGRLDLTPAIGLEAFVQTRFRPNALDMCGTFWSVADYTVEGCDKAFAGMPAASDRARDASGSYMKRLPTPKPDDDQYGAGLTWKSAALASDFGVYYARYTNRTAIPGLRKSSRVGPGLIPGDPDGKNLAFFTEYPGGMELYALTFLHKRAATSMYGELAYRPAQPLQIPPGDVLSAFLSATAPSLIRAQANVIAPGGLFHGYDSYPTTQAQLGLTHEWKAGGVGLSANAEAVLKHVGGLPDPALRRYGRADLFGVGPVNGVCTVTTANAAKQCSMDGYVTDNAYAYRLKFDARFGEVLPGLNLAASVLFIHDVKGWSHDFLLNEGRKSMNMALRAEYRQRYLAEVVLTPIWGGQYNHHADRDQLAFAVGVKF